MVPQSKTRFPTRRASQEPAVRAAPAGPAKVVAGMAPAVRYLVVGAESVGQRLDNFLFRVAKGVPKSHVYRVVRSGEVRINGGRSAADYRLIVGDVLRIPPLRLPLVVEARAVVPARMPAILFEDEHLLVLNKPAGLAVHGGSGVAHGVIELVRAGRPHQPFLELGHRLDRETSGVLLLAKTRTCLLALHAQLREGRVDKRYLTVVCGDWVNARQHVRLALVKRSYEDGQKRVFVDAAAGVPAHTIFHLRARLDGFSLLEAELKTGRTHQIRVHLAHLGFPILGDAKYGDFASNRLVARGELGPRLGRMFLHAWRVQLQHPVSAEPLIIEAPVPEDCADWLAAYDGDGTARSRYRAGWTPHG